MKFEIVIRTGGLSEDEVADLRRRARMQALELRISHPDAQIFLIEEERKEKGEKLEIRRME